MKLADRKPHPSSSPESLKVRRKCILAREVDVAELTAYAAYIERNVADIRTLVQSVHPDSTIDINREFLDEAEKRTTILRTQLKAMRKYANLIAKRDAREENGVLIP